MTEMFSATLGFQAWLNEGSDFAPEDNAQKNRTYYFAEVGVDPGFSMPLAFNLRYLRDLNVADRNITAVTLGLNYRLPL
jgi:hypothetical protein